MLGEAGSQAIGDAWLGAGRSGNVFLRTVISPVSYLDAADPAGYVAHGDRDNVIAMRQYELLWNAALANGVGPRLRFDSVDSGERIDTSTSSALDCRWHIAACGVNAAAFDEWVDAVASRSLG